MENQVNIEDSKEAMEGMVVKVSINPSTKELFQIGGVAAVGAIIGTGTYLAISNWMQKRKYKKTIEEINKGFNEL
jgi:hypothetical protein